MKKQATNKIDNKYVYGNFRKNLSYTLSFAGFCSLIMLVLYILFYVAMYYMGQLGINPLWSILIFVIFIAILLTFLTPFIYSYFACNTILKSKRRDEVRFSSFLKTSQFGFRPPFKGQLNVMINLLYSAIIYVVVSGVLEILLFGIYYATNAPFAAVLDSIFKPSADIIEIVDKNWVTYFQTPMMIVSFIAVFCASSYFLLKMGRNIFKFYLVPSISNVPKKLLGHIFNRTIKMKRKEFYGGFLKYTWIMMLVYALIYSANFFIMYYGLNNKMGAVHEDSIVLITTTSIVIAMIFVFPLLPILFNYYDNIWPVFGKYFLDYFIRGIGEEIERARNEKHLSSEDRVEVERAAKRLEEMKESLNDQFVTKKSEDEKPDKKDKTDDKK